MTSKLKIIPLGGLGEIGKKTEPGPDPEYLPQEPAQSSAFDIELIFLETPTSTTFHWPFSTPPVSEISNSFKAGSASFPKEKKSLVLSQD